MTFLRVTSANPDRLDFLDGEILRLTVTTRPCKERFFADASFRHDVITALVTI
jgi:hypothetical protein